jgi:hypothetical protein
VWDVEYTEEFEAWWSDLDADEQDSVAFVVQLLVKEGPTLPWPYSSDVSSAKKYNIRELRVQHQGSPYRVLYAFDPRRSAVLILGGDKTGNDRWYEEQVPRAEKVYGAYLSELRKEGLI